MQERPPACTLSPLVAFVIEFATIMTFDKFTRKERQTASSHDRLPKELASSVALILSFLQDPNIAVRERSLNRLVELKSELTYVPMQLAQFLLEERDARLVAKGVQVVASCVSQDPLASPLITHFLGDPRQLVAQSAQRELGSIASLPLELRYPYQSSLAFKHARSVVQVRARELYQKIHPYVVVEGAAVGARPFLNSIEALCLPVPDLQHLSIDVLCRCAPSLDERQRGVVEAACTYSCHQIMYSESSNYEGFLELLREVSSKPSIARMVHGIECGDDLNRRLHRDFTASYISRMAPLKESLEQLASGLWHNHPAVVAGIASNIGVLMEEFPYGTVERLLDNVFEVLIARADEGREIVQGVLRAVHRQRLYEDTIIRRVSEIVARADSSHVLLTMIDVIRVNPPQQQHNREIVSGILRYLQGAENTRVADAARELIEWPERNRTIE
jgi:hypothetical protein